jgi:hypothetical protein
MEVPQLSGASWRSSLSSCKHTSCHMLCPIRFYPLMLALGTRSHSFSQDVLPGCFMETYFSCVSEWGLRKATAAYACHPAQHRL